MAKIETLNSHNSKKAWPEIISIGEKKPPEWLYRDFILGYFGEKVSIAQKGYRKFVTSIVNKKYDNPLDEVVSSTLLGNPDFIAFIKDKFLPPKKPDKDIPALKELIDKASPERYIR